MKEQDLILRIKTAVEEGRFAEGKQLTAIAMMEEPDSPVPHNLLGILLEETGDHTGAMKHFRAAAALDPACIPARHNMESYGCFNRENRKCAYTVEDCAGRSDAEGFIKYASGAEGKSEKAKRVTPVIPGITSGLRKMIDTGWKKALI